jgi:hypothetical protein
MYYSMLRKTAAFDQTQRRKNNFPPLRLNFPPLCLNFPPLESSMQCGSVGWEERQAQQALSNPVSIPVITVGRLALNSGKGQYGVVS